MSEELLPFDHEVAMREPERVRHTSLWYVCFTAVSTPLGGRILITKDDGETLACDLTNLRLTPPKPRRVVRWVNVYAGGSATGHETLKKADGNADKSRIALWRIESNEDGSEPTIVQRFEQENESECLSMHQRRAERAIPHGDREGTEERTAGVHVSRD